VEGKTFFVGTGTFAVGILYGTLYSWPQMYVALFVYCGVLCITIHVIRFNRSRKLFLLIGIFLVCTCAGILRAEIAPRILPQVFNQYINVKTRLTGEIVADPDIRTTNQQITVNVTVKGVRTNILVFVPPTRKYIYGESVAIIGKIALPKPFASENGRIFRYDHYLAKKHIFATMEFASVYINNPPTGFESYLGDTLFSAKHLFISGLRRALPPTYAALATGLLTGDQHQINENVLTVLSVSGLVWVIVLSGYHVMVIAEAVLWLLVWLPQKIRLTIAALVVAAVIFATGASAPSLRGGMMVTFTLFARGTNRTYNSLRALGVTVVLLLLWNPLLLAYDSGFQLSIIVTPALILCVPILESRLLWIPYKFIREIITVSVVAQLSILPLLVWQDGNLEVWAIIANVFVMPLVPLSMLCSVIAGFAGILLPSFAKILGWPAHMILYLILATGQSAAQLPYSNTALPPFSFVYVIFAYAFFLAIVWKLKKK
jgi:competence protein ComEC